MANATETWRLSDIFPSDEAWEEEFVAIKETIPKCREYVGRVGESAATLQAVLDAREALAQRALKLGAYAHLAHDLDTRDARRQAMWDRAMAVFVQANSETAYIEPEILALPPETVARYQAENQGLDIYRFALAQLERSRPHILSADGEQLLAMAGEVASAPREIYGMIHDADMRFPDVTSDDGEPVTLSHARFVRLLESPDRALREKVFRTYYDTFETQRNTFAAALAANVKKDIFFARARRHGSCLEAALHPNNIPTAVYENLIATLREHLPILHRYIRLRKRILGLPDMQMWDVYVPLVPDVDRSVSYDEARDTVLRACRPLGDAYVTQLREGLSRRWVDVHEAPGKRSGAYSSGVYGIHPFVLLNWQGNLNSVFTLAHEMGHAMHSHFSTTTQPFVNSHYSIFVAEVASTTNEALLLRQLLRESDEPRTRVHLLNHLLDGFRTTVFRQAMFAEFEQRIHQMAEEGGALTADALCALYGELNRDYYGPDVASEPEIAREWMRIPHFYLNFYVYQYATGFCAAQALAEGILQDESGDARKRYLKFLTLGGSDWPIDELKVAGVDMTSPEPIHAAMRVFEQSLTEMEELL